MKQLLFISCVAGVCWASEDDQGYGSAPKVGLSFMQDLQQSLLFQMVNGGIKREGGNFYIFRDGVWNLISNELVFCQFSDQPEKKASVEKIEKIVRGWNHEYGKTSKLKEFKQKHVDILSLISSFCTMMGASTYNEHCKYSAVNRWSEACEEEDDEGNMVVVLRKNSKDSPRALTPCPLPESPKKKDSQFFQPVQENQQDVVMGNGL